MNTPSTKSNTSIASRQNKTLRAIYLGSEPMGELLEGENGSDAVQVPLKRTILRTDGNGDEVDLFISNQCLNIRLLKAHNKNTSLLNLPIDSLAYCGALRQLPAEQVSEREFETLDKIPQSLSQEDPPLFVTIFRNIENENTLLCHSFVLRKDTEAMDLVKYVMESYYDILKQFELNKEESVLSSDERQLLTTPPSPPTPSPPPPPPPPPPPLPKTPEPKLNKTTTTSYVTSMDSYPFSTHDSSPTKPHLSTELNDDTMRKFLDFYKSTEPALNSVSARDILEKSLDPNKYEIVDQKSENSSHTNESIVIKKKNDEKLVYEQNVYVRWLQPPTPPPPAPIIIREVQGPQDEEEPPIIIYKQAPREPSPPPLVIRERPPSPPPKQQQEPIIIERMVKPDPLPRRVIIEELPAPPPKPRDIILEKWLPQSESPKRQVIIEKKIQKRSQSSKAKAIEYLPSTVPTKEYSPERQAHQKQQQHKATSKVAGYRIIRQIIPGPNATAADIEKALARSKHISTAQFKKIDDKSNHKYQPPPPPTISNKHISYHSNHNHHFNHQQTHTGNVALSNHSSRSRYNDEVSSKYHNHHRTIRHVPIENLD